MLTGVEEAKVSNIISLRELLCLGELRDTVVASQDNRAVEVLVAAVSKMIHDADDEYARRLLALRIQVLCITLDKEAHSLVFHNRDHVLLVITA